MNDDDDEHYVQTFEAESQEALPFVREKQFVEFKTDNDDASAQAPADVQPQILAVL